MHPFTIFRNVFSTLKQCPWRARHSVCVHILTCVHSVRRHIWRSGLWYAHWIFTTTLREVRAESQVRRPEFSGWLMVWPQLNPRCSFSRFHGLCLHGVWLWFSFSLSFLLTLCPVPLACVFLFFHPLSLFSFSPPSLPVSANWQDRPAETMSDSAVVCVSGY